jgi:basic amino acid/polyamine antiporter, APA family
MKRVLGLPAISFIAIGFTIGGGIFVFTGIVLKMTGPALPVAYAIAVIPIFMSMLPLAMLGSAIPCTGGNYRYPSRMVSPGFTFVFLWIYILATFFGQIPLYSIACARYVRYFFPGMSEPVFAVLLITFFYVVNVVGIRIAAWVQGLMVIALLASLLYFSVSGLTRFDPALLDGIFQKGPGNLLLGVALLTFTYLGSNGIIELGGEIRDPGRVIPRAFFIALPVITVIYLLVALTAVGVVPWSSLTGESEPLIRVGNSFLGRGGMAVFVLGGAVLALTTTLNGLFIVGTKSLLVIIKDGLLPGKLGTLNRRFGTAHVLFTIIWVLSIVGVVSGLSLETFASYAALGGILIFVPLFIAAMRFPKLYPEEYRRSHFKLRGVWLYLCPAVGFCLVLFFSLVILADLKSPVKIGLFICFALSGVAYYILRKRNLKNRGIDLAERIGREDWHS